MWQESKPSNYKAKGPGLAGAQTNDKEETEAQRLRARGTQLMWMPWVSRSLRGWKYCFNSALHAELSLRIAFKLYFKNGGRKGADSQGCLCLSAFYQTFCKFWGSSKCYLMSTRVSLERGIFFHQTHYSFRGWSGFGFYEQLWLFHKVCFAFTQDGIIHTRRSNYLFQE